MHRILALATIAAGGLVGCEQPAAPGPEKIAGNAGQAVNPPAAAPAQNPHQSALERLTTTIVDRNKALAENPGLVELEKNELGELDPITYAGKAYFSITSRLYVAALKHEVDLYRATNDKFPPFEEFEKSLRANNVTLQGLYRWQVYAYDDSTGEISILEDREKKRQIHEEAGLEFTE